MQFPKVKDYSGAQKQQTRGLKLLKAALFNESNNKSLHSGNNNENNNHIFLWIVRSNYNVYTALNKTTSRHIKLCLCTWELIQRVGRDWLFFSTWRRWNLCGPQTDKVMIDANLLMIIYTWESWKYPKSSLSENKSYFILLDSPTSKLQNFGPNA